MAFTLASDLIYDAVIVGSGAGGSAAAYRLANAGRRIAIVEKGYDLPLDNSTLDVDKVVRQGLFKSKELWHDNCGNEFAPEEYFNVGGKTKWYGAALLRYRRREFESDPAHGCLGWPLSYDDIQPYYDEAEKMLGARTFAMEPDLNRIVQRLSSAAPEWRSEPLPMGLVATICNNKLEASHFDGFASVAHLKADGETTFLSRIRQLSNVHFFTGAAIVDLLADAGDATRITGVRLSDGRVLRAQSVLLAAGALHSPRLLQRHLESSGLAQDRPNYKLIGGNLKLHFLTAVVALSPSRKTDLLRKTALLFDQVSPHSSVQPLGFDSELIATLIPRFVPRAFAKQIGERAYGFFLQTEDGSHIENRVQDMHQGLPVLDYDVTRLPAAFGEHKRLVRRFRWALAKTGFVAFAKRIGLAGTAHACGTLVAGLNSNLSVVNRDGQVHGLNSLYVVDGSVLPRSSRVNPSLTIYAWAMRVADRLIEQQSEIRSS